MTGKQEAEATITLHEAGFEVSVDQVENDIPEGEVIEQDPSAESEAEKGSTVAITVSLGPGTVKVPKVDGLSVAGRDGGRSRTRASRPRSRPRTSCSPSPTAR